MFLLPHFWKNTNLGARGRPEDSDFFLEKEEENMGKQNSCIVSRLPLLPPATARAAAVILLAICVEHGGGKGEKEDLKTEFILPQKRRENKKGIMFTYF